MAISMIDSVRVLSSFLYDDREGVGRQIVVGMNGKMWPEPNHVTAGSDLGAELRDFAALFELLDKLIDQCVWRRDP